MLLRTKIILVISVSVSVLIAYVIFKPIHRPYIDKTASPWGGPSVFILEKRQGWYLYYNYAEKEEYTWDFESFHEKYKRYRGDDVKDPRVQTEDKNDIQTTQKTSKEEFGSGF